MFDSLGHVVQYMELQGETTPFKMLQESFHYHLLNSGTQISINYSVTGFTCEWALQQCAHVQELHEINVKCCFLMQFNPSK